VAAVMDAAELSQAALFATAEGAIPAILFAAHHPERVTALVVLEGSARYLAAADYPEGFNRDPTPPLE
jgi:pimeloyl-ACP methyl ester carboxylesterase